MASGGVAGAAAIRVDYPRPALDDRREASNVHPMHPLKSPVFALAGAALLAGDVKAQETAGPVHQGAQ